MLTNQSADIIETDIAIIGGGNAGISLAAKLKHQTTVVVEPKHPDERDASWALWAKADQLKEYDCAIKGQWNQWRLIDHQREILHTSDEYQYISLSSADYLRHCESKLSANTQLMRAHAEDIQSDGDGGNFVFLVNVTTHSIFLTQGHQNWLKMV